MLQTRNANIEIIGEYLAKRSTRPTWNIDSRDWQTSQCVKQC